MSEQKIRPVTYWVNYYHENDEGREVHLRCRIYADNGQKETRWEPGYLPDVFLEEVYLCGNSESLYLPQKHRFYDCENEIIDQFYEEMECRAFDCPIMD